MVPVEGPLGCCRQCCRNRPVPTSVRTHARVSARGELAGGSLSHLPSPLEPLLLTPSNPSPAQTPALVSRPMAPSPGCASGRVSATHPPPRQCSCRNPHSSKWCHHLLGLTDQSTAVPYSAVPPALALLSPMAPALASSPPPGPISPASSLASWGDF